MEKTRIIAHALFDGWVSIRHNSVYELGYCNKNEVLVKQFAEDVSKVYGVPVSSIRRRSSGAWEITYRDKNMVADLLNIMPSYPTKNLTVKLPAEIAKATHAYPTFLRAFWDDEGTVNYYPQHRTRKLRAPCKPSCLRAQLLNMHLALDVDAREEKEHFITISGSENLIKFNEKIGFTSGVHVGRAKFGKDVWTGYEKAEALNLMIRSETCLP